MGWLYDATHPKPPQPPAMVHQQGSAGLSAQHQEVVLYRGTWRQNLDPMEEFTEERQVSMRDPVARDVAVADYWLTA